MSDDTQNQWARQARKALNQLYGKRWPLGNMDSTLVSLARMAGWLSVAAPAVPPTGRVELSSAPNTESSPTTTAATRWQATLKAEKAAILDFVVDGKIGDDPSPPAVVGYTERAATANGCSLGWSYCGKWPPPTDPVWCRCAGIAAALSAVASEHQTEIASLREQVDFFQVQYQDEIGLNGMREERDNAVALAKFALLARLREPEMRDAVAHALHRSINGPQAVWDGLSLGEMDWFRSHADAALAVITEKLT